MTPSEWIVLVTRENYVVERCTRMMKKHGSAIVTYKTGSELNGYSCVTYRRDGAA